MPTPPTHRRPHRSRGITLLELLVAIFILVTLSLALVQLLSSGMYTFRTGEMRKGAYERGQFIFSRVSRDLNGLYPHNPPMPERWTFQVDSLFSENYDGTGVETVTFTSQNISRTEGETRDLHATNPSAEAWVEYEFTPPVDVLTAVMQPKLALARSDANAVTCRLVVEAGRDGGGLTPVAEFESGLRDQIITPSVDVSSEVSGGETVTVRLRIVPESGQSADIKLFPAREDDPLRPVLRFAVSPKTCRTEIKLVSDYRPDGTQYLAFVRSNRGLAEVAYFVEDQVLYRIERDTLGGAGSLLRGSFSTAAALPVAKGIACFGCEFPARDGRACRYWREADSVPPYVNLEVTTVPLSGAKTLGHLRGGLSATRDVVPVDSTEPFPAASPGRPKFFKIDDEWISYTGFDKDTFTGCARGRRGTVPAAHAGGARVVAGETFLVRVPIPAWGYRNR
jgi:hypothetical protein